MSFRIGTDLTKEETAEIAEGSFAGTADDPDALYTADDVRYAVDYEGNWVFVMRNGDIVTEDQVYVRGTEDHATAKARLVELGLWPGLTTLHWVYIGAAGAGLLLATALLVGAMRE
jgi:hypothetical protein